MYHNGNPNIIENHDDTEVQSAALDLSNPEAPLLIVTYTLKPGDYSAPGLQLHSTNGVNHRYDLIERRVAEKSEPVYDDADSEAAQEAPKSKKGK